MIYYNLTFTSYLSIIFNSRIIIFLFILGGIDNRFRIPLDQIIFCIEYGQSDKGTDQVVLIFIGPGPVVNHYNSFIQLRIIEIFRACQFFNDQIIPLIPLEVDRSGIECHSGLPPVVSG